MGQGRFDRNEFANCLTHLCWKLQDLGERAGAPGDTQCDIEEILAGMPRTARPKAKAMLNAVQLASIDEHPAMAFAARYVLKLADELWRHEPAPMVLKPLGERPAPMQ